MSFLGGLWGFAKFLLGGPNPRRKRVSASTAKKIREKWQISVVTALQNRQPAQLRQALITADKLLDTALKEVVAGENMGGRLKAAKDLYDWEVYDKIWKAHKVRNALVHDINYEPTYYVLEEAIADLKVGIMDLGVAL